MVEELKGIPAAPGFAKGPAFQWDQPALEIPDYVPVEKKIEVERLSKARQLAAVQLEELADDTARHLGEAEAALFEAQAMFAQDTALIKRAEDTILTGVNAERAWQEACEFFAAQLESLPDETFQARSADVRDVAKRVIGNLLGVEFGIQIDHPVVLVAADLAPSQTVRLDRAKVLAFCTAEGGPTSHTAILAKALGIPAVVGLGKNLFAIPDETMLLVDGSSGTLLANPAPDLLAEFEQRIQFDHEQRQQEISLSAEPALTMDGERVEVVANVGNVEDARLGLENGAEGIGLLRTEFLFLNRNQAPDEQTQYRAYRTILNLMAKRPVVVRTLDIGGDKEVPYYNFGRDANPFLGYRAIRISLDRPEEFKVQLRALLRAGAGHDLRVMFPMISTLDEVRQAKALFNEAVGALIANKEEFALGVQVGIMVEIPSVSLLAERFAREVDFFSVGTNDLTQYTLAAERGNPRLSHLNDACHPAVLYQIHQVVQAAHGHGKWVGVCGELAGDPQAIPLLLGLGVDELSISPALIPHAKHVIRKWDSREAKKLAVRALNLESAAEVRLAVNQSA